MAPSRDVQINNAHSRLRIDRRAVAKAIHLLDLHRDEFQGGCPAGELSIAFLTDTALAKIHGDFLDDPTKTDVITFEGDSAFGASGEICVSADKAKNYAAERGREFSEELTLYVVHGWLHLAGYDDLKPEKKRKMRAAEKRAMILLGNANLLPKFSFTSV